MGKLVRAGGAVLAAALITGVFACNKGNGAASGDKIGIAECDDYLDKYEKCIKEKAPEVVRPALEQALRDTRANYKKLSADAATKAALPKSCEQAKEVTKTTMAAYGGCAW